MAVSYSGLSLYKQCPSAFKRRYITKEQVDGPPLTKENAPALFRGKELHAELEDFLEGKRDDLHGDLSFYLDFMTELREAGATAENRFAFTEEWEPCEFDAEEAMIRGIDDACIMDEDTKTVYVYDWKTGKIYLEHDDQRALYGLAALLAYPTAERAVVTHVYLDQRENRTTEFFNDSVEGMKWVWERKINKTKPPQPYPEIPSWKCKFCDYSTRRGGKCQY